MRAPPEAAPRGPTGLAAWRWSGASPGALALHGFTGDGRDFAPLAERLGRALLAPDLLGHGDSSAPPDEGAYTIRQEIARLAPLAAPILIGYSMGGRIALSLAASRPPWLRALVLIGASPGLAEPAARAAREARDRALADRVEAEGAAVFLDWWAQVPIISTQTQIPEPWRSEMRARRRARSAAGLAGSLRGAGAGRMAPVWAALSKIQIPTLLVTGALDTKFDAINDAMAAEMPAAERARIPGAGHCAHLERPDDAAAAIRGFLDRVAPTGTG